MGKTKLTQEYKLRHNIKSRNYIRFSWNFVMIPGIKTFTFV
jgi:hypothetical protein